VVWDAASGSAELIPFSYREGVLDQDPTFRTDRLQLTIRNWRAYRRRFNIVYAGSVVRNKVFAFAADPKIPRARHLKSIVNIESGYPLTSRDAMMTKWIAGDPAG
jgi:hypothetical protein